MPTERRSRWSKREEVEETTDKKKPQSESARKSKLCSKNVKVKVQGPSGSSKSQVLLRM